MNKTITFTNTLGLNFYPPKPAVKDIPEWYIKMPEYTSDSGKLITHPDEIPHTIKKCIPVLDSLTTGYILYTQVDLQVTQDNGYAHYIWPSQSVIGFHPPGQLPLYPGNNVGAYAKWINPYAIKTPPGYSSLFVPPFHRESIFTILPGIVDTDKYVAPVNFPFVLNNLKWEGIIEAGTPMAQVIPFKRDSWKHSIGSEKELIEQNLINKKLKTKFFNSYKKQFWDRKEYK